MQCLYHSRILGLHRSEKTKWRNHKQMLFTSSRRCCPLKTKALHLCRGKRTKTLPARYSWTIVIPSFSCPLNRYTPPSNHVVNAALTCISWTFLSTFLLYVQKFDTNNANWYSRTLHVWQATVTEGGRAGQRDSWYCVNSCHFSEAQKPESLYSVDLPKQKMPNDINICPDWLTLFLVCASVLELGMLKATVYRGMLGIIAHRLKIETKLRRKNNIKVTPKQYRAV